jgi:hypothetical protein
MWHGWADGLVPREEWRPWFGLGFGDLVRPWIHRFDHLPVVVNSLFSSVYD